MDDCTESTWTVDSVENYTISTDEYFTENDLAEPNPPSMSSSTMTKICDIYVMLILGVATGGICIGGMIGNALTFYTIWPTRNVQSTSMIMIALAMYDSMFLAGMSMNQSVTWMCRYFDPNCLWIRWGHPYWNAYIYPAGRFGHIAGTWAILLLTFHRYVAVCHPLKAKNWCSMNKAKIQLSVLTVCLAAYSVPRFFTLAVHISSDGQRAFFTQNKLTKTYGYAMIYETIIYYLLGYVIPFPLLFVMTYKLVRSLKKMKNKREKMTGTSSHTKEKDERDLTRTLIAVVIVFIVCQTPSPIRRALNETIPKAQKRCGSFFYFFHPVSVMFLMLNSAVNIIIYYKAGRRFRIVFHARMKKLLRLPEKIEPSISSSENGSASNTTRPTTC